MHVETNSNGNWRKGGRSNDQEDMMSESALGFFLSFKVSIMIIEYWHTIISVKLGSLRHLDHRRTLQTYG